MMFSVKKSITYYSLSSGCCIFHYYLQQSNSFFTNTCVFIYFKTMLEPALMTLQPYYMIQPLWCGGHPLLRRESKTKITTHNAMLVSGAVDVHQTTSLCTLLMTGAIDVCETCRSILFSHQGQQQQHHRSEDRAGHGGGGRALVRRGQGYGADGP